MSMLYITYLFLGTVIYMKAFLYAAEMIENIERHGDTALRYLFLQESGYSAVRYILFALGIYTVGMIVRITLIFSPWSILEYIGYLMGYAVPIISSVLVLLGTRTFAETTRKMSER